MSDAHRRPPRTARTGSGVGCSADWPGAAAVLGLLIAAYAIGYHRGQHRTTARSRG